MKFLLYFGAAALTMIVLNIGAFVMSLSFSSFALLILYFSISEELSKFFWSKTYPSSVFGIIMAFATLEAVFIKLPLVLWEWGTATVDLTFFIVSAIIFHASTAFVYSDEIMGKKPVLLVASMVSLHIIYNGIDVLGLDVLPLLAVSLLIAISPYIFLLSARRLSI